MNVVRQKKQLHRSRIFCSSVAAMTAVLPLVAQSYVGPGAGLSAIGTILALLGAVVLAVFGFLWYPIKRLLARRRERKQSRKVPGGQPPK